MYTPAQPDVSGPGGYTMQVRRVSPSGAGDRPVPIRLPDGWLIGVGLAVAPSGRTLAVQVHEPAASFQPLTAGDGDRVVQGRRRARDQRSDQRVVLTHGTQFCVNSGLGLTPIDIHSVDGRQLSSLG